MAQMQQQLLALQQAPAPVPAAAAGAAGAAGAAAAAAGAGNNPAPRRGGAGGGQAAAGGRGWASLVPEEGLLQQAGRAVQAKADKPFPAEVLAATLQLARDAMIGEGGQAFDAAAPLQKRCYQKLREVYRHLYALQAAPGDPNMPADAPERARRWRDAGAGGSGAASGKRLRADGAGGSQVGGGAAQPGVAATVGVPSWMEPETLSEAAFMEHDRCLGDPFGSVGAASLDGSARPAPSIPSVSDKGEVLQWVMGELVRRGYLPTGEHADSHTAEICRLREELASAKSGEAAARLAAAAFETECRYLREWNLEANGQLSEARKLAGEQWAAIKTSLDQFLAVRVHSQELLGLLKQRDAAVRILQMQLQSLGVRPHPVGIGERPPSYPELPPVPDLGELLHSSLAQVVGKGYEQAAANLASMARACRVDVERQCSRLTRAMEEEVNRKMEEWRAMRLEQFILAAQASTEATKLARAGEKVPPFPYQPGELELAGIPRTASGEALLRRMPPPGADVVDESVASEADMQMGDTGGPGRAGPEINCPNCGVPLRAMDSVCPACGTKLQAQIAVEPAANQVSHVTAPDARRAGGGSP